MLVGVELVEQVGFRDEVGDDGGEVGAEVVDDFAGGFEGVEAFLGHEEGGGEGFVRIGDRDEHGFVRRPDVQVVCRDAEVSFGGGGNAELAPEFVDVFLLVGHGDDFHQVVPHGGVGTDSTNPRRRRARAGRRSGRIRVLG